MAPQNSTETWMACEPGMLQRLSNQGRRRAYRRLLLKRSLATVSGVAGCLALGVLLLSLLNQDQPSDRLQPAGGFRPAVASQLHCPDVLDRREAFLLGSLSDVERARVSAHLGLCQHCQEVYRQRAQELGVELLSGRKSSADKTVRSLLAAR